MRNTLKFVIGNWKMLSQQQHALLLARDLASYCKKQSHHSVRTVICPTFTQLVSVEKIISEMQIASDSLALGAQDCYPAKEGAFTGDVSATMLSDIGVRYVIIGHSERRQKHHESNEFICEKVKSALEAGLIPVICIGETLAERQEGKTAQILEEQILGSLPQNFSGIIAYEPVWAIGTGITPTMDELQENISIIRTLLEKHQPKTASQTPLLYGGSVKSDQSADIFSINGVDGVLVGGASLKADEFIKIIQSAPKD
ncbi:triose-phosphate isomerase [Aristophania vespae]|uniref:Triosephosphate isomerase n=1 Tax=Aristophania vespae TaxID=2697033 RepID=A0A6P1NG65_9PROT|nr:triose-phosphate isomerase [Aristophania vespae]QHI95464.1 triose-phosphate isomerase [Aristophania vespae]UMM64765.1 Triosephosphate isomerase [Aristophania vespae]